MEIAQRLKDTRIDLDKTQSEVAKALNTTQHQISKYENGKQELTATRLKEICIQYQVSADYILGLPKGLKYPR